MTRQELKEQRLSGNVNYTGSLVEASIVPQVAEPGDSSILRQEPVHQVTDADYNRIPLSEVSAFRQFRNMDPLHRTDAMGNAANRGSRLKAYLKEKGVDKFLSHYKLN